MAFSLYFLENWLSTVGRWQKVNVSVTESVVDCRKEFSRITLTRQSQLICVRHWVSCSSRDCVPVKCNMKLLGLQFSSADRLILLSTPHRICLTILLQLWDTVAIWRSHTMYSEEALKNQPHEGLNGAGQAPVEPHEKYSHNCSKRRKSTIVRWCIECCHCSAAPVEEDHLLEAPCSADPSRGVLGK